jgi:hypothetical protein
MNVYLFPTSYLFVYFVIMPNRFYGIIILNEDDESIIGENVVRARDF